MRVVLTKGEEPIGNGIGPVMEMIDIIRVLDRFEKRLLDLEKKSLFLAGQIFEMTGKAKKGKGIKLAKEILDSNPNPSPSSASIGANMSHTRGTAGRVPGPSPDDLRTVRAIERHDGPTLERTSRPLRTDDGLPLGSRRSIPVLCRPRGRSSTPAGGHPGAPPPRPGRRDRGVLFAALVAVVSPGLARRLLYRSVASLEPRLTFRPKNALTAPR